MNKNLIKRAFTLIELLVVIAIVGILSGLIIVGMSSSINSARIAKAQIFSASLRDSLLMNLVSEWKLDTDGSDSWGSNIGTINGAVITSSNCVYGSCLSYAISGTNYVTIPDSASLDGIFGTENFTFDVWIYSLFKNTDYQGIINKRSSGYYSASPGGLFINNDGNTLNFLIGTGNDAESANSVTYSIASMHDSWINAVATANGSNLKLYVNGALVAGPSAITLNPPTNNEPMTIGAFYASVRGFYGKIDNVRIYNAPLPASQIKEQYFIGLNRMLSEEQITKADYEQRLAEK